MTETAAADIGKRPPRWRRWLVFVAFYSLAGAAGYIAARTGFDLGLGERLSRLSPWDVPGAIAVYYLCVLVHEGGHLLGGLAGGARWLMITVGPLRVTRSNGRLHLDTFLRTGGFGGLTVVLPDTSRPMPPQLRLLIAGGPIASLVLALAGLAVAQLAQGRVATYGAFVLAISGLLFALTVIPFRMQGFRNDAAQLLQLWRGGSGVELRQVLLVLGGQSLSGVRPRDLDDALLQRAFALDDGDDTVLAVSTHHFAYLQAWDRGDMAAADRHLSAIAAAYDGLPQGLRQMFAVELAFFHAQHHRDADAARAWLARGEGGLVEPAQRETARAALALLEARTQDALRHVGKAEVALSRHYDPGSAKLLADTLSELRRCAQAD